MRRNERERENGCKHRNDVKNSANSKFAES